MSVKLLTNHLLEVLCLKGGCTGSSESTLVKMLHCWKSMSQLIYKGYMGFQWVYNDFLISAQIHSLYIGAHNSH